MDLSKVKFIIIKRKNAEKIFADLEELGVDPVLIGLTDEGYEILAKNVEKMQNYIALQQEKTNEKLGNLIEQRRLEAVEEMRILHSRIDKQHDQVTKKITGLHDSVVEELKKLQYNQMENRNFLSDRITSLERWKYMMVGGAIVLGLILGLIPKIFPKIIQMFQ